MAITIEQFVAELGWDIDNSEFKKFKNQVKETGKELLKLTKWIYGGTTALVGMATLANQNTAEQYRLAKSVGASAESMEALAQVAGGLGLNYENVIDLVEEMNNKIGEMKGLGEMTAVKESMQILKMDFKEIRDLAPEEQFIKIMDAAQGLADQSKAVSAVDMLMGGEANKILGFLRTQNQSMGELLERYRRLNFLTEEGRQGAVKYSNSWRSAWLVLSSSWKEFSGIFGKELAPYVDVFTNWAAANKEILHAKIADWAKKAAYFVKELALGTLELAAWLKKIGDQGPSLRTIGLIFAGWKIGQLAGGLISVVRSLRRAGPESRGLAKSLTGSVGALSRGGLIGVLGASILDSVISINKELNGQEGSWHDIGEAIGGAMSELDKYAAALFDMSVEEYRMKVVEVYNTITNGYKNLDRSVTREMNRAASAFLGAVALPAGGGMYAPAPAPRVAPRPSNNVSRHSTTNDNRSYGWEAPITINTQGGDSREISRAVNQSIWRTMADTERALKSGTR